MKEKARAARRIGQFMNLRNLTLTFGTLTMLAGACSVGGSNPTVTDVGGDVKSVVHVEKQDARIRKAEKTEPLLDAAGFKYMPIDNPAKQKVIGGLTPLSFNRLGHHHKIHYWFADPYYCNCVYVGDGLAYERYKDEKRKLKEQHQEEMDLVESENEVALPMDSEWNPYGAFDMP